ncbi:site-specific integrase [Streptomyces carpaticus]|uniref:site-specific integrase n=1 Tax=Streptomyces carpaticus TaxID=285558 RepID=UPI0031F7C828
MPATRRGGGITTRCECRGLDGKRLGVSCPKIRRRGHGKFEIHQELPDDAEGGRRRFRRTGYATKPEAEADLDRVRAILKLPIDGAEELRVGDLLAGLMRDRSPIPEPEEVSKRLGVGVPLDGSMLLSEWLDTWLASKKTKRKTKEGYASHIEVHLRPAIGHIRLDRLGVGHVQAMFDAIDAQNEVRLVQNQQRREQQARCKWKRKQGGRPSAADSARLAVERERLAAMPPFRTITGPATQQRIRATLRTALNGAIGRQLITFNAAQHVELAPGKRPKAMLWTDARVERWQATGEVPGPVMVWTLPQIGRFLDEAETSRLYALFHVIAHRGPRRGEGVGLGWDDMDWEAQEVMISKEIIVDGWVPVEDDPKTDGSAASIGLDSGCIRVLRDHRVLQLAERDAWNAAAAEKRARGEEARDWVDTGKMFTAPDGSWLHPEAASDEFRAIVERAGLPPISLRDLRHCAATLIHAAGGDIHVIKEVLRHSSIQLTSDTYTSLLREVDLEIAERAAALIPRARNRAVLAAPG